MIRPTSIAAVAALALSTSACHQEHGAPSAATSAAAPPVSVATPTLPVFKSPTADEMQLQWDIGKVQIPADNAQSELGHQLFFDKRLSVDRCHS